MKKQDFFVTFLSLVAFCLGVGPGTMPSLASPLIVTLMLFVILRFCVVFLLVCSRVHVKAILMLFFFV